MNPQNTNSCENNPSKKSSCFCFIAGPTGPIGPTGPQGAPGMGFVGPTGPTGPAAMTVRIGTIRTGDPGSEATVTNVGTDTDIILDFVIPSGITGDQGEIGPTGATGPQGEQGPKGDPGIEGPTGPAAGLNAYGGLFSTTRQDFTQIQDPLTVTLDKPMEDYRVTEANNTVTIVEGGIYEINYTVSATLNETGNLEVDVRSAGRTIDGSKAVLELTQGVTGTLAKSFIVDLTDGAALSLALVSSTSQTGGSISQATLSVKLLD